MKVESTHFSFAFLFSSRWRWASRRDSGVNGHGVCQNSLSRHWSSWSGLLVSSWFSWFSLFSSDTGLQRTEAGEVHCNTSSRARCLKKRFRGSGSEVLVLYLQRGVSFIKSHISLRASLCWTPSTPRPSKQLFTPLFSNQHQKNMAAAAWKYFRMSAPSFT